MNFTITPAAAKFIRMMIMADGGRGQPVSGSRSAPAAARASRRKSPSRPSPLPGDAVVERDGVKLFLPAESRLLLDGVTIDFADTPIADRPRVLRSQGTVTCSQPLGDGGIRARDDFGIDSEAGDPSADPAKTRCFRIPCSAADFRRAPSNSSRGRPATILSSRSTSPRIISSRPRRWRPDHFAVLIGFYRFYFYKGRLREALTIAKICLAKAAREKNFAADWRDVQPDDADFGDYDDVIAALLSVYV